MGFTLPVLALLADVPANPPNPNRWLMMWGRPAGRVGKCGLGRDHAGRHDCGIVRARSGAGSARGHPGCIPPRLACPRHAHRSRITACHGHCRTASPHHGIARGIVRGHRRSTHNRVSRRIRLDHRHRPGHHGTRLASRTAGSLAVIMNDLSGNHARREGRGGRRHVHSIMFLGPSPAGIPRNAASRRGPCGDGPAACAFIAVVTSGGVRRVIRLWPRKRRRAPRHRAPGPTLQGYALRELLSQVRATCRAGIPGEGLEPLDKCRLDRAGLHDLVHTHHAKGLHPARPSIVVPEPMQPAEHDIAGRSDLPIHSLRSAQPDRGLTSLVRLADAWRQNRFGKRLFSRPDSRSSVHSRDPPRRNARLQRANSVLVVFFFFGNGCKKGT